MDSSQASAHSGDSKYLRHWRVSDNGEPVSNLHGSAHTVQDASINPTTLKPQYGELSDVPPSHPSYGVMLSPEAIREIVSCGWPGSQVETITPLGKGKSFNNKIYFLEVQRSEDGAALGKQDFVLKVNGSDFDGDKVQNEVACLRLLELYCPEIPVPRVLAWSESGHNATFISSKGAITRPIDTSLSPEDMEGDSGGWVLTSRVPGEPLVLKELDSATISELAIQIADIVASWRHKIPPQKHCGSLKIRGYAKETTSDNKDGIELDRPCGPGIADMAIRGIVVEEIKLSSPIINTHEYYKIKLEGKLKLLEFSDKYARNRHLLGPLRTFSEEHLPKLNFDEMFKQAGTSNDRFLFTQYDLFPRNILVSGSPARVTGLVDFEFSGFFPPMDEFLDDWVDADWPESFYTTYLERLEEKGVATPVKSVEGDSWHAAYWVEKIIENTTPWWVPGDLNEEQVERALSNSERIVWKMLNRFGIDG